MQGHSFLNRFLFTCVPWSTFSLDSSWILGSVLKEMANNLEKLFWNGLEINGRTFRFALIGVKGDAEFHVEAGEFQRSYMTVGTTNNLRMCPECHADDNFGDVSDNPAWLSTVALFKKNESCSFFCIAIFYPNDIQLVQESIATFLIYIYICLKKIYIYIIYIYIINREKERDVIFSIPSPVTFS